MRRLDGHDLARLRIGPVQILADQGQPGAVDPAKMDRVLGAFLFDRARVLLQELLLEGFRGVYSGAERVRGRLREGEARRKAQKEQLAHIFSEARGNLDRIMGRTGPNVKGFLLGLILFRACPAQIDLPCPRPYGYQH